MAKSELSRDAIVDRALQIADAEGLEAITVRRISKEFGVTPMALYWHVENKDDLLDAMGDRIFAEVQLAPQDDSAPWDEQLRESVAALIGSFRRHPSCMDLVYRRIFSCPDGRQISERTLRLLRRAGFSPRQTADLATHALQTAMMLVTSEPSAQDTVADDVAAKLAEKRAALEQLSAEEYPFIREMAGDLLHCDDLEAYYDFGVDLFVAGARDALARSGAKIGA